MNRIAGVYEIKNTINGHIYIGSSCNVKQRWNKHKLTLNKGINRSTHLQCAWNKYGEQVFEFTILLICDPENTLYYEQIFMDALHPEYNIAINATASMQGLHMPEKTKRKISDANKGRVFSEETRRKLSEANKGNVMSEEARKKIGEASKGHVPWNKGKRLSKETRAKMSEAHQNISEETRRKISEAGVGRKASDETRRKIIESNKRRTVSEETRLKISESCKGKVPWNKGLHKTANRTMA